MNNDQLLAFLCTLRDLKFTLASQAFRHHYDAYLRGCAEESAVIRRGALKELEELLTLERWVSCLGGAPGGGAGLPAYRNGGASELGARCRVLALVHQRLSRRTLVAGRLRSFLAELAAEEAGRVEALAAPCAAQTC